MKIGIYIDGLGQSVARESVIKYATRLKNEYSYHKTGVKHELKIEKIKYGNERESNVVSIIENDGAAETVLYKFYEFKYDEILTGEYKKRNILIKNLLLFSVVIRKFPLIIKRLFSPKGYSTPFQTFYLFILFFIIAGAILLMVPATLSVISSFMMQKEVVDFVHAHKWIHNTAQFLHLNSGNLKYYSEVFVSTIAIILLIVPQANTIITSLATEFICANFYLQFGQQKQDILGNIDQLFEYISENEKDSRIHFHTYSFGSLIALDYLFPFGKKPSGNMLERTDALITIGTPFSFIDSYYPRYYLERNGLLTKKLVWLNVYSIIDSLGSNFRNDAKAGDAEFGIPETDIRPVNLNYEVIRLNKYSLTNFLLLNNLKVHSMYWSKSTEGQSCLNTIYAEMIKQGLLEP